MKKFITIALTLIGAAAIGSIINTKMKGRKQLTTTKQEV